MAETTKQTTEYTIDATGKSLGRVATQAATILMGKNVSAFQKHKTPDVVVTITNASKANISVKKLVEKRYKKYSGYPGGLKQKQMKYVVEKGGMGEAFRTAVKGMIPRNKLRPIRMKNLIVNE